MNGAGEEKVRATRLRIGQNCRVVCTKSGLNASGQRERDLARDALSNHRRESAVCFERPAEQVVPSLE